MAENTRAIDTRDDSEPTAHQAAEHVEAEAVTSAARNGDGPASERADGYERIAKNAASLAASDEAESSIPNAIGVLTGEPVKARKSGASKPSAKSPTTKAAAKKASAKAPAKKPTAKSTAKKADAKPAAKKAANKPAAKKAAAKAPRKPAAKKAPAKAKNKDQ